MPCHLVIGKYLAVHIMPQNPADEAGLDPANDPSSFFIIVSAKALSSVGFGLSLLAIWFNWMLPDAITPSQVAAVVPRISKPNKKQRTRSRSSTKPVPPTPIRGASAPVSSNPLPILDAPRDDSVPSSNRHVYFADSPSPVVRRNTMPVERTKIDTEDCWPSPLTKNQNQILPNAMTTSPHSSPLTLPGTPPHVRLAIDHTDDVGVDSDSSRQLPRNALGLTTHRLQRLRLSFNAKGRRTPDKPLDSDSTHDTSSSTSKSAKRGSGGFGAPWGNSRKAAVLDPLTNLETVSTKPLSILSFSKLSSSPKSPSSPSSSVTSIPAISLPKKSQRRTSTPIPRTLPYGAPYFATPPLLLDDTYTSYLRGLPQFGDNTPSPPDVNPVNDKVTRGREFTYADKAGRPVGQRPIHKRRSASESCAMRIGSRP